MRCLCSKTYCFYDIKSDKKKISSKGLNKRVLEEYGNGPMANYRKVFDEAVQQTEKLEPVIKCLLHTSRQRKC